MSWKSRIIWQMRSVWTISPAKASQVGHKAPFPLELARRCIALFSLEGDMVYEPFCGSGTTIIAADKLGRTCCAMELEQRYVDLAILRWQEFTGQQATLEGDGRTFYEIAAERR